MWIIWMAVRPTETDGCREGLEGLHRYDFLFAREDFLTSSSISVK